MAEEAYLAQATKQEGKCAIFKTWVGPGPLLCIDHDHASGQVRELLCRKCNTGIGMLQESVTILQTAVKYLRRHGRVELQRTANA